MSDADRALLDLCAKFLRASLPNRGGERPGWVMVAGELVAVNDVLDAYENSRLQAEVEEKNACR